MLLGYTEVDGRYLIHRPGSASLPTHASVLALCTADGGHFPMYKTPEDVQKMRSFTAESHWLGECSEGVVGLTVRVHFMQQKSL